LKYGTPRTFIQALRDEKEKIKWPVISGDFFPAEDEN
jgi:hypothetical protein